MRSRERKKGLHRARKLLVLALVVVVGGYGAMAALVSPVYSQHAQVAKVDYKPVAIDWPKVGSASVGSSVSDAVVHASLKGDSAVPSASTIKLLTALVVLEQKPLGPAEPGEAIYFGAPDEERYQQTVAKGGVALTVPTGTTLTYREALDAMLVMSANNIADKLAIWAYGSVDAYTAAAGVYAQKLNLRHTTVTDASGLLATTVTSPNDMVLVARAAMSSPVVSTIVRQKTATLADGRVLTTTNTLLNSEEVIGLKTGTTNEAGNCLVVSKKITIGAKEVVLYVSVFGQTSRDEASRVARGLLAAVESGLEEVTVASKGEAVAYFQAPWGETADAVARDDLKVVRWKNDEVVPQITLSDSSGVRSNTKVGTITVAGAEVDLVLDGELPRPSLWWRLFHAVDFIVQKM